MKFSKNFKRILSAVLCLCMIMGTLFVLTSCDTEEEPEQTDATSDENKVTVVRAIQHLKVGTQVKSSGFEEVLIDKDQVPTGAYSNLRDVANKYLTTDVYAGDYLFPDKVSDDTEFLKSERGEFLHEDYVVITDYLEGVSGDMSVAIQKAIDENPNKTIYFPDGTYPVYKPIKTSADPAKCVSFRLSTYAVITAGGGKTNWEADGMSVIQLGAKDDVKSLDAKYSFIGGVVNAGAVGTTGAIEVCGGNVLINNVSIKKAEIGITVKGGARADIDSCVVTGNGENTSIGVLVESEENTLTNMRICHITIGVKLTGANNVLRNIHPLFVDDDSRWSTGFYDVSAGNFYDVCYSDQFAVAFYMGENTRSIYNSCFGFWYGARNDKMGRKDVDGKALTEGQMYGFYAATAFNSIIRDTRINLHGNYAAKCDLAYLRVEDGAIIDRVEGPEENSNRTVSYKGNGVVLYPRAVGADEHVDEWFPIFCKTEKFG